MTCRSLLLRAGGSSLNNQKEGTIAKVKTRPERDVMIITITCPYCKNGIVKYDDTKIADSHIEFHMREHAYKRPPESSLSMPFIGANCDCPRTTRHLKRPCGFCLATGEKSVRRPIPVPGDKVIVTDEVLLKNLFGDDIPEGPGTVYQTIMPEKQKPKLELPNGLAIYVTWDRLNKKLQFPKGSEGETWVFDISELRMA